jgi:hypothetical protein
MDDTLDYMIRRSRFDADRLLARRRDASGAADHGLIEDAANALFACTYVQVCGSMLARSAAERQASSIESAVRQAGLEKEVVALLKAKSNGLCGFFQLH